MTSHRSDNNHMSVWVFEWITLSN